VPKCRLCGEQEKHQTIRAPSVYGGTSKHKFWECACCDAIYLDPILSEEEEKLFYLKEFEGFMSSRVGDHRDWTNADLHKSTNQDQVARRLPYIEKYLSSKTNLLEIGCSSGFMLDAFRSKGVNCVGVEPSGEFSEYLVQNGHCVHSSIDDIEDQTFDVICHFFVFEHIADPCLFLEKSMKMLNEGGIIIAEIPCANDPLTSVYKIDAFEKFYWSIAHHYYYTKTSMMYLMNKLAYKYEIVPEQRYDLSNHLVWMNEGRPGGQKQYLDTFGEKLNDEYKQRMRDNWTCDTMFLYIWK